MCHNDSIYILQIMADRYVVSSAYEDLPDSIPTSPVHVQVWELPVWLFITQVVFLKSDIPRDETNNISWIPVHQQKYPIWITFKKRDIWIHISEPRNPSSGNRFSKEYGTWDCPASPGSAGTIWSGNKDPFGRIFALLSTRLLSGRKKIYQSYCFPVKAPDNDNVTAQSGSFQTGYGVKLKQPKLQAGTCYSFWMKDY